MYHLANTCWLDLIRKRKYFVQYLVEVGSAAGMNCRYTAGRVGEEGRSHDRVDKVNDVRIIRRQPTQAIDDRSTPGAPVSERCWFVAPAGKLSCVNHAQQVIVRAE
jgi:hypothetical protein